MVIGIAAIMAAVSSVVYGNLQVSTQVSETTALVAQNLRLVRERGNAGLGDVAHGIKFEPSGYTLFRGSSYALRQSSYDRTYDVGSALVVSTTLDGDEVIFLAGLSLPSSSGEVTVSHVDGGSETVSINSLGVIEEL